MVKKGRLRNPENINPFKFKESKPNKYLEISLDFDKDIDNGFNIIVLAQQPGIGKTYNALKYMEENPNTFYFTDRHRAIEEHTSNWNNPKKKIEYSHWKGFNKICDTEEINKLYNNFHFYPYIIFDKCKWNKKAKDKIKYDKQFKNRVRVFAPFNYLNSPQFRDKNFDKPKIVFIDERITQLEEYKFNPDELANHLKLIGANSEYISKAKDRNCYFFFDKDIRNNISNKYFEAVIDANRNDKTEVLNQLKDFNPYELAGYIIWGRIYKYNSNVYAVPYYYYALDALIRGIPIVIMDATFNVNLFHYFLESYNGEMRELKRPGFSETEVNVKIYYSEHKNPDTKIYRMRPRGSWSRSSIEGGWHSKTTEWLSRDMRNIMDIFGPENVGVISYKTYGDICQSFGFDFEFYGALRGTNLLQDKMVLVIVGGWFPPPHSKKIQKEDKIEGKVFLEDLVWKYFYRKIAKDDILEVRIGAPSEVESSHTFLKKGIARFSTEKNWIREKSPADMADGNPVSMINSMFCDEVYQAFHRNRGLRYPRIIFAYCWFPEPESVYHFKDKELKDVEKRNERFIEYNLRDEFHGNIRKVNNDYIDKTDYRTGVLFFDWLATKYSQGKVLRIIREFEKGDKQKISPSPTTIANKYKIWEGSGKSIDNKLIERFREVYEEVKEKAKVKSSKRKK